MKTLPLRGLAALALLVLVPSCARAGLITFGPLTTPTFLDVTIDYSGGVLSYDKYGIPTYVLPSGVGSGNYASASHPSGWGVGLYSHVRTFGTMSLVSPIPAASGRGNLTASYMTELVTEYPDHTTVGWSHEDIYRPQFGWGDVVRPVFTYVGGSTLTRHITWDITSYVPLASATVPDAAATAPMLAAILAALGFVAHRFRGAPAFRR